MAYKKVSDITEYLDELPEATQVEVEIPSLTVGDRSRRVRKHQLQQSGILPVQYTWAESATMKSPSSNASITIFGESYAIKQGGTYYVFYEYYVSGPPYDWRIGLAYTTDPTDSWTLVEPLISGDTVDHGGGATANPDYYGVADPCVLYIPWSEYKWHMWFDMSKDATNLGWTIGHAYTNDPTGAWIKQMDGDLTAVVIGTAAHQLEFDGWSNAMPGHAPECFLWGGVVHCIANVWGAGHTQYDPMLYIACDNQGIGTQFKAHGPVAIDTSIDKNNAERLQPILQYGNFLYSNIREESTGSTGAWVVSGDGGRSWQQIGVTDHRYKFSGKFIDGSKVYAIQHGKTDNGYLWVLDLENLTGHVDIASNVQGDNATIPIIGNVYRGYYTQGKQAFMYDGTYYNLAGNNIKVKESTGIPRITTLPTYTDEAAALGGGLVSGDFYKKDMTGYFAVCVVE